MKRFLFIVSLVAGLTAIAVAIDPPPTRSPDAARPELAYGTPTADYALHNGYVSARPGHYTPWVIEYLTAASFAKRATRDDASFAADHDQPREFRATNTAYLHSGYDRGHMAPANDMTADPAAMKDCFLLSNMMPQTPQLNRGSWRMLEEHVGLHAAGDGVEVWVVTGPAWLPDRKGRVTFEALGDVDVWAPTHCWKAVLVRKEMVPDHPGHMVIWSMHGWLLPNVEEPPKFQDCEVSVDVIEKAAGLDLFSGLEDEREDRLEDELEDELEAKK